MRRAVLAVLIALWMAPGPAAAVPRPAEDPFYAYDGALAAVAPGTVLLPEGWDEAAGERLRATTPLGRHGDPADVAQAMLYLLDADFVTGETIVVDGGRHVRR